MKTFIKIFVLVIIALMFGAILKPILAFFSGILSFGMGLGLAYLVVSWMEDKWKWFR
jgi:hypothetical protein